MTNKIDKILLYFIDYNVKVNLFHQNHIINHVLQYCRLESYTWYEMKYFLTLFAHKQC